MIEVVVLEDGVSGPAREGAAALNASERAAQQYKAALRGLGGDEARGMVAALQQISGMTSSAASFAERLQSVEGAVTSELQKQLSLEAQIATFDANRYAATKKLESELAKMQKDALPKEPAKGLGDVLGSKLKGLLPGGLGGEETAGLTAGAGAAAAAFAAVLVVVVAIGAALKAAATFALGLAMSGAQLAIEASNFRAQSIKALTALTGSGDEAERLYSKVRNIARLTGESTADAMGRFKKLLADGFDGAQATKIMKTAADIAAVRGEQSAQRFQSILENLQNKGTADKSFIKQVSKAGIDSQEVYRQLAATTHKSVDQVKADLKAGTVTAADAIRAVQRAASKRYGGAAQNLADGNVLLQFANLQDSFKHLFSGVDLSPVAGALHSVIDVLEGGPGAELKSAFGDLFGAAFEALFGPLKSGTGKQQIAEFVRGVARVVHEMATGIRAATPAIKAIGGALMNLGVGGIHLLIDAFHAIGRAAAVVSPHMRAIGIGLAVVFGPLAAAVGMFLLFTAAIAAVVAVPIAAGIYATGAAISALVDFVSDGYDAMKAFVDGLGELADMDLPDLLDLGADLIKGLVAGIESGAASVVDSLVGVCTRAISAAKDALGIASPSRVFQQIGAFTSQGMAQGIAANDNAPADASAAMAQRTAAAASYSAPSASGGGASGGGGRTINVTVAPVLTVHAKDAEGGKEAGEAALAAFTPGARDAVLSALRDIGEEAA